jgi:hypothetical protein
VPRNPTVDRARARAAALSRHHTPDNPAVLSARADLKAAGAEVYVRRVVDEAPRLSADQLARLAGILSAAAEGVA